jgi:enamine deaminase RidA (YjgF/YER057c/UK114 family)
MRIEHLKPAGVWDSTQYKFAQAVLVRGSENLLFIAGQVGMDERGQVSPDSKAQIRQCFENIRRIVIAAGGGMGNIVRITGYLRDMSVLPIYTKIVGETFGDNLPAATVIEVRSLALESFIVEVDAIAAL